MEVSGGLARALWCARTRPAKLSWRHTTVANIRTRYLDLPEKDDRIIRFFHTLAAAILSLLRRCMATNRYRIFASQYPR